jgi:hypothetical protein|tara:strand:+ start:262 stop:414 length:153 start_codon:yes stop_codon:yes gene_type:complete
MRNGEYTLEQFKAIRRNIKLGRMIKKDHPEIAELYRGGSPAYGLKLKPPL